MKTTILAAATALTLAFSFAPSFAAEHRGNSDSGSNIENQCDNILANRQGHAQGDVRYCEQHQ